MCVSRLEFLLFIDFKLENKYQLPNRVRVLSVFCFLFVNIMATLYFNCDNVKLFKQS